MFAFIMVYVDSSKPDMIEGFTKNTFTAMIEGVRKPTVAAEVIETDLFEKGVKGQSRTCETDGVFCYSLFKVLSGKV